MNAPTSPPLLLTAHAGGVLRLILNRPNARNALSSELMAALKSALDSAAAETLDALDRELSAGGVRLLLTHVKGPVRDVLARTGMLLRMARTGRIYLGTHEAVTKAQSGEELIGRDPEKDPDPRALADRVGCGETARRLIPRAGRHGEGSGI